MTTFRQTQQQQVKLTPGAIRYRELGTGEPVVFVHGLLVNSLLWEHVADALAKDFRVIAPDLPLGSNELPLDDGADTSPPALAKLIAEFLEALDLHDVTLVGNDTGGALCQLLIAEHPERVGRLVLTPCDAYENFPPPIFAPTMNALKSPAVVRVLGTLMRPRSVQRSALAYGLLTKRPIPDDVLDSFLAPLRTDKRVRRQMSQTVRGIDKQLLLDAAKLFGEFDKPVLIAWAPKDVFFKFRFAERLANDFPNGRLERIEDSRTFVSLDQPRRTSELIASFAREPVGSAAQWPNPHMTAS
ncbi:MAG TPA: alpha/beta hydrolase [Solirubrobacteraceae bacterium]|nr:alpha/beta hydrolase [Solirubrobacteraceae bacterium]